MQEESRPRKVLILIDVVDTIGVESARSTDQSMDLVAFLEEEFGKVATVLARNAGD